MGVNSKPKFLLSTFERRGHHPAFIGEILFNRYVLVTRLNLTIENSIWIAKDLKCYIYVRIKIFREGKKYILKGLQKLRILQFMQKVKDSQMWKNEMDFFVKNTQMSRLLNFNKNTNFCVNILNCFLHKGILGLHFCLVEEFCHDTLGNQVKLGIYDFSEMELYELFLQMGLGVYFLHVHCGLIHGNLNPDRIFLKMPNEYIKQYMIMMLFQARLNAEMKKHEYRRKEQVLRIKKNKALILKKLKPSQSRAAVKPNVSFFETGFDVQSPKKKRLLKTIFLSGDESLFKVTRNFHRLFIDEQQIEIKRVKSRRKNWRRVKKKRDRRQKELLKLRIKKQFFEDFVSEKGICDDH